jgi:hypothetical protein
MRIVQSVGLAVLILAGPQVAMAQDHPQQPQLQQQNAGPDDTGSGTQASAVPGTPDLAVATVRATAGHRASKIVGAAVYNGANQQIGTVDDIILNQDGKAQLAIIAVGGFLGVGSKLVAEPYSALKLDPSGKVLLPDGSKDSLNNMPAFTYG